MQMKKIIALAVALPLALSCFGQRDPAKYYAGQAAVCGGMDSIMARRGGWKKDTDDLAFPDKTFPSSQYKLVHARSKDIIAIIQESVPHMEGMDAKWYTSIRGDAYIPNGPVPYSIVSRFFEYYCNTNYKKIILGDETSNKIEIFVNRFSYFLEKADEWDIRNDGKKRTIYQLPPRAGKVKDFTVYEIKSNSNLRNAKAIIIGRNGKVPWNTLSRKEYLTGLKGMYETQLKKFSPGSGSANDYDKKLKYINDFLSTASQDDLEQHAIIDPKMGIWGFKGTFGEENNGGFRLVVPVLGEKYFDKTLPRDAPQLIEIYWSYSQSPVGLGLNKQIENNFPLEKLKAMIAN